MASCIAHIRTDPSGRCIQSAAAHCRNTARYASKRLDGVGLARTAYFAGLIHDMGKFTILFSDYITRAANGEPVRRGEVNHTFSAVRFLLTRYHGETCASYRDIACEVLAVAAGAHHGLFDCIDDLGRDGLLHRLDAQGICFDEAVSNFLAQCATTDELDALFDAAAQELASMFERCKLISADRVELAFLQSMLCRLLLSAVIDGDRQDTAEFMYGTVFPDFGTDLPSVWSAQLAFLEEKLSTLPLEGEVNRARRDISNQCRAFALHPGGVLRLSAPTGGGKTLAVLRYALSHAAEHRKSRILFISPLLSVLDQNAAVIRAYLGDDSLVLEHHSNLVQTHAQADELDERELLTETWDASIIITTLVQFLNTLFLGKPTAIRRLYALTNSVIVIDEVQSVPRHMLSQFNLAINFLSTVCHATVVLCSATQPCLEAVSHPLRYSAVGDIIPFSPALWSPFKRTEILDCRRPEGYTSEQLAQFARDLLISADSLLIICNTKAQAGAVFACLQGVDALTYHLSTSMCMHHRMDTLAQVNACLDGGRRVVCVATQLVEAGVDFSFETVIRVSAGMDNVVQAAGRCNRSGEFGRICPVYIVNFQGENLSRLPEIRSAQIAAEELLADFVRDGAAFGYDLLSDAAIRYYYRRLFSNMKAGAQDYPIQNPDTSLFRLLSDNADLAAHCPSWGTHFINQAFRTAGDRFQVFEDNTVDVLVPYGQGAEIISELCSQRAQFDPDHRRALLIRARPYAVGLYAYQKERLEACGGLYPLGDGAILGVLPPFYDPQIGLNPSGNTDNFMEV